MTLKPHNLDDRNFQQLLEEAKRIIKSECPQWTDLSPGDPGIVILELFAHLTETMIYRLKRLPEKAYVEFLRLIGVKLSPPVAASVTLHEAVGAEASQAAKPVAAIHVGAGADVELVRNGPHLLLSGLKKRLDAYDTFKLTLVFEKAGSMVVEVAVEEAATVEPHKH